MNPDVTQNLQPPQLRALTVLLETGDKSKAAKAAKVSRTTLYRWLHTDPAFGAALEDATRQALREFSQTLVRLAAKAAAALDDALGAEQEIGTRLRAADIVTGRLLAVRELIDLEERIAALETAHAQNAGQTGIP